MGSYDDDFEGVFQSISIKFGGLDVNSASKSELTNLLNDPTTATCIRFREVFDIPKTVSHELAYTTFLKVLDVVVLSRSEKVFIEDLKQFRKDMHLLKDIHYYVKHLPAVSKKTTLPMWLSSNVKDILLNIPVEKDGMPDNITIINCLKEHSAVRESVRARQEVELLGLEKYSSRYNDEDNGEGEGGDDEHTNVEHLTEEEILDRELERTTAAYWNKKAENVFRRADIAIQDKCLSRQEITDYLATNPPPDQVWILKWLMEANGGANFEKYDRTKDGEISIRELKEVCKDWASQELGSDFANANDNAARMLREELNERAETIMKKADKMKRNEKLTKNEIASFGNLIADAEERLFVTWFLTDNNFDVYDIDKSGEIDISEFKLAIRAWANDQRNHKNQFVERNKAMLARKRELVEERRDMLKNADSRASEIMEICGYGHHGHLITVLQMRNKVLPVLKLRPFAEWMLKDRMKVWRRFDKDKSGTIDLGELENALEEYFDEVASEFDDFRGDDYMVSYRGSRRTKRVLAELGKRPSPPMFKGSSSSGTSTGTGTGTESGTEKNTITLEWRKEWQGCRLVLQALIVSETTTEEALEREKKQSSNKEKNGHAQEKHQNKQASSQPPLWTTIYRGKNPRAEITLSQPTSLYLFRTVTVDANEQESLSELSASNAVFWMNRPIQPSLCGIGRNMLVSWCAPVLPPFLASKMKPSRPFWKLHIKTISVGGGRRQLPSVEPPSNSQNSFSQSGRSKNTKQQYSSSFDSKLNTSTTPTDPASLSQRCITTASGDGALSRIGSDELVINIGQGHTWSLIPNLAVDTEYEISLSVEFPMGSSNKSTPVRYSTRIAAPVIKMPSTRIPSSSSSVDHDNPEKHILNPVSVDVTHSELDGSDDVSSISTLKPDEQEAKNTEDTKEEDRASMQEHDTDKQDEAASTVPGAVGEENMNSNNPSVVSKKGLVEDGNYRSGNSSILVMLPSLFDPDGVLERAGIQCNYRTEGLGSSGTWEMFHKGIDKELLIHGFALDVITKLRVRVSVDLRRCCRYGNGPIHIQQQASLASYNPLIELGLAPLSAFGSTLYNEDLKGGGGVHGHVEGEEKVDSKPPSLLPMVANNDLLREQLVDSNVLSRNRIISSSSNNSVDGNDGNSLASFQSTTTVANNDDGAWLCPINLIPFPGSSKARSEKFAELVANHNTDYDLNLKQLTYFWDISSTTMVCVGPSLPTFYGNEAELSTASPSSLRISKDGGSNMTERLILTCKQPQYFQNIHRRNENENDDDDENMSPPRTIFAFEVYDKASGEWCRAYTGTSPQCNLAEVTRAELTALAQEEGKDSNQGTVYSRGGGCYSSVGGGGGGGYSSGEDDDSLTNVSAIKRSTAASIRSSQNSRSIIANQKNKKDKKQQQQARSYLPSDCWTLPGVCLLVRSALYVNKQQTMGKSTTGMFNNKGKEMKSPSRKGQIPRRNDKYANSMMTKSSSFSKVPSSSSSSYPKQPTQSKSFSDFASFSITNSNISFLDDNETSSSSFLHGGGVSTAAGRSNNNHNHSKRDRSNDATTTVGDDKDCISWTYSEEMIVMLSPQPPWCEWCNEHKNAVFIKWSDAFDLSKLPKGINMPPLLFSLEVASGPLLFDDGNGVKECQVPLLQFEEVAVSPGSHCVNSGPLLPGCRYAFRLRCDSPQGYCLSSSYYVNTQPTVPSSPALPIAKPGIFKSATGKLTAFVQVSWNCPEHNGLSVDRYLLQCRKTVALAEGDVDSQSAKEEGNVEVEVEVEDSEVGDELDQGENTSSNEQHRDHRRRGDFNQNIMDISKLELSGTVSDSSVSSGGGDPSSSASSSSASSSQPMKRYSKTSSRSPSEQDQARVNREVDDGWTSIYIGPHLSASDESTLHTSTVDKQYRVRCGSKLGWSNWSPILTVCGSLNTDGTSDLRSPQQKKVNNSKEDDRDNTMDSLFMVNREGEGEKNYDNGLVPRLQSRSSVEKENGALPVLLPTLSTTNASFSSRNISPTSPPSSSSNQRANSVERSVGLGTDVNNDDNNNDEGERLLVEKGEKFECIMMVPCCGAGQRMKLVLYSGQAAQTRSNKKESLTPENEEISKNCAQSKEKQGKFEQIVVFACSSVVGSADGDKHELWLNRADLKAIDAETILQPIDSKDTTATTTAATTATTDVERNRAAQKIFDNLQINRSGKLFCLRPPEPSKPIAVTLLSRSPPTFLLTMPAQGRIFVKSSTTSQNCQLKVLFPRLRSSHLIDVELKLLHSLGVPPMNMSAPPTPQPSNLVESDNLKGVSVVETKQESVGGDGNIRDKSDECNHEEPIEVSPPRSSSCTSNTGRTTVPNTPGPGTPSSVRKLNGWSLASEGLKLSILSNLCKLLFIDQVKGAASIVLPPNFQHKPPPPPIDNGHTTSSPASPSPSDMMAAMNVYWNPINSSQFNLMESWELDEEDDDGRGGRGRSYNETSFMARDAWGNRTTHTKKDFDEFETQRDVDADDKGNADNDDDEEEDRRDLEERIVLKVLASMTFGVNEKVLRKVVKACLHNMLNNNPSSFSSSSRQGNQGGVGEEGTTLPDIRGLGMASLAEVVQAAAAMEMIQYSRVESNQGGSELGNNSPMKSPNNPRSRGKHRQATTFYNLEGLEDVSYHGTESGTTMMGKKRRAFTPQLPTNNLTSYSLPCPSVLVKKKGGIKSPSKLPPIPMTTLQWGTRR